MYQRIWTMVYSFLMFILVRNAVQYALLALLYQLAQSGASGGLVDLLILRDETGAYNGYSGDVRLLDSSAVPLPYGPQRRCSLIKIKRTCT